MTRISLKDESNDRKYFTIIPNFILNHSTIWDREVYIQMKRVAGEDGTCFLSVSNLKKRCGIGTERLKKSIKYLIEHKWISFIGKKNVSTHGGIQKVNEYKINDLWKLNVDFYDTKGGSQQEDLDEEIPKGGRQRGVAKGGSPQSYKKNLIKEEPIKEETPTETSSGGLIPVFIDLFKEINPTYKWMFGRPNQRDASERLLKLKTFEEWQRIIKFILLRKSDRFCPRIATPLQLEQKYPALESYALTLKAKGQELKEKYPII